MTGACRHGRRSPAPRAPSTARPCSTALDAGKHTSTSAATTRAGNWGVVGSVVLNLPKTGPQTTNGSAVAIPAERRHPTSTSRRPVTTPPPAARSPPPSTSSTPPAPAGLAAPTARHREPRLSRRRVVPRTADIPAATVKASAEGIHHVLRAQPGPPRPVGSAARHRAAGRPHRPRRRRRRGRPEPDQRRCSRTPATPATCVVSAQITDPDAGRRRAEHWSTAPRRSSTRRQPGAGGTGLQLIAVDGKFDSTSEQVYGLIPLSQVKALRDGSYHVYVRGKDAAGNWGPPFATSAWSSTRPPRCWARSTGTPNPTDGAAAADPDRRR